MREIWRRSKDRDRLLTNPHYMAWDEWWGKGNKQDFPSTLAAEEVRRATRNAYTRVMFSACVYAVAWVLRSAQVAGRLRLFAASTKRFERRAGMPHLRWFVDDLNSMNVDRSRRITHRNSDELPPT